MKHDKKVLEKEQFNNWIKGSHDSLLPINGAKITLIDATGKTVQTYTTDQYYNGVYVLEVNVYDLFEDMFLAYKHKNQLFKENKNERN